ncbi:MAG: GNAT family N-acetyltransferase [Dysgonamonadaceae bacterium]|jgi:diamine N-acetyltransferase|nr:GNAT family N-acetyltransferase [Dysgonamonadaceae bacterium]
MTFLENDNIKLRALEPEDLDVLYRWENESEWWFYGNTSVPFSKFTLREYLASADNDIYQLQQLRLMVIEKTDNLPIGTIDLYDFNPMHQRAGVGIMLDASRRGKGLGTQALTLIKEYAFNFLSMNQLYAYIPQGNTASIKLFERCGFEQTGQLRQWIKLAQGFEDACVYQLLNLKSATHCGQFSS